MNSEDVEDFKVNQLVWAQISRFPFWPAVIYKANPFVVVFLGEQKYSEPINDKNKIKPYDALKVQPKYNKRKGYKLATKIAEKILSGEIKFDEPEELFKYVDEASLIINTEETKIEEKSSNVFTSEISSENITSYEFKKKVKFITKKRNRSEIKTKSTDEESKIIKNGKKSRPSIDAKDDMDDIICSKTPDRLSNRQEKFFNEEIQSFKKKEKVENNIENNSNPGLNSKDLNPENIIKLGTSNEFNIFDNLNYQKQKINSEIKIQNENIPKEIIEKNPDEKIDYIIRSIAYEEKNKIQANEKLMFDNDFKTDIIQNSHQSDEEEEKLLKYNLINVSPPKKAKNKLDLVDSNISSSSNTSSSNDKLKKFIKEIDKEQIKIRQSLNNIYTLINQSPRITESILQVRDKENESRDLESVKELLNKFNDIANISFKHERLKDIIKDIKNWLNRCYNRSKPYDANNKIKTLLKQLEALEIISDNNKTSNKYTKEENNVQYTNIDKRRMSEYRFLHKFIDEVLKDILQMEELEFNTDEDFYNKFIVGDYLPSKNKEIQQQFTTSSKDGNKGEKKEILTLVLSKSVNKKF